MEQLQERAVLIGVHTQNDEHFEYSMEELGQLAEALAVEVVGVVTQNLARINPSHYVGKGKVEEIQRVYEVQDANLLIFNDELTPSQIRNLEQELSCKVIDRTLLILDIFARRARSRESRMQVELAQLQYMLPRLVGLRASLGRQGGGTGGGFQNKGAGETKLELDRRVIVDQISSLRKELESVQQQKQTQRKRRQRSGLPVVSLVGYTNAGKSTIMNELLKRMDVSEEKQVFEKDLLFATLDTSVRQVQLEDNKQFLLTDTVGFVSKLPHHLVKAFRSTLEEARDADLLLQVVDISHPEAAFMMEVTNETLQAVGVEDVTTIDVFNKSDRANLPYPRMKDQRIWLSAKEGKGLDELMEMIRSVIFAQYKKVQVLIPYHQGEWVAYFNEHATIHHHQYGSKGTYFTVEVSESDAKRLENFEHPYEPGEEEHEEVVE